MLSARRGKMTVREGPKPAQMSWPVRGTEPVRLFSKSLPWFLPQGVSKGAVTLIPRAEDRHTEHDSSVLNRRCYLQTGKGGSKASEKRSILTCTIGHQGKYIHVARSQPLRDHYHVDVIYLHSKLGIKEGTQGSRYTEFGEYPLGCLKHSS